MGWGYGGEGEQFWRGWDLGQIPEGFSFVRSLKEANDGELPIFRAMGKDQCCRYAADLGMDPKARRALVRKLRGAYWWVRNRRWVDSVERVADEEEVVLAAVCFLELAGVPVREIVRLCQCHSHTCVCDGCDEWDGDAIVAWTPDVH